MLFRFLMLTMVCLTYFPTTSNAQNTWQGGNGSTNIIGDGNSIINHYYGSSPNTPNKIITSPTNTRSMYVHASNQIRNFIVNSYSKETSGNRWFYAQDREILYYGEPRTVSYIVSHKNEYFSKWPTMRNTNIREFRIQNIDEYMENFQVTYVSDFLVANRCRKIFGVVESRLIIRIVDGEVQILSEDSDIINQSKRKKC